MIFDNERDFKKQIKEINNRFGTLISDFMGIGFEFSVSKSVSDTIYNLDVEGKFITSTKSLNKKIAKDIVSRAASFMTKYIDENDTITARLYNDFIDEVSMSLIFEDYIELDEEKKLNHLKFIEDLKNISFKTYECNRTNMGILLIPNNINKEELIKKFPFDFITINTNKTIRELIESEKPMLKIIDNKSIALVVDNNFIVTGIIKKKQNGKSIHQIFEDKFSNNDNLYLKLSIYENLIMLVEKISNDDTKNQIIKSMYKDKSINNDVTETIFDYINKDSDEFISLVKKKINGLEKKIKKNADSIKYISIRDMVISYYGNENFLLTYSKSKWKIKQYSILLAYIFEYIIPNETLGFFHCPVYDDKDILFKEIDELLSKICKLVNIIKSLSLNNNGALFIILDNSQLNKEDENYLNKAIPKGLIKSDSKQIKEYKSVIRDNSGSTANILEIDNYLLESIASVDGATILDDELNIISFSEIININGIVQSKKQNIYGARTTAAISVSKYGLAIKVSEDGYIEVYKDKKFKMKI